MRSVLMQLEPRSWNFRRASALLCLGLFLVLTVFAASEKLHHSLHSDAAVPEHECVITLLAQGQFTLPEPTIGCSEVVLGFVFSVPTPPPLAFSSFDYRLSPTRGPPVV